jgi:DNA polymerase III alpha subunit
MANYYIHLLEHNQYFINDAFVRIKDVINSAITNEKLDHCNLERLTYSKAYQVYGKPLLPEVDERLLFELNIIETKGFSFYFMLAHNLINIMRNDYGINFGPGYSTSAGSLVAYCLDITKIDPLKHGLLFERFINLNSNRFPSFCVYYGDGGHIIKRVSKWGWAVEDAKQEIINFQDVDVLIAQKNALLMIKQRHGIDVDLDEIPINDEQTFELFQKGQTIGVFEFDSAIMRKNLRKMHPTVFEELVALYVFSIPGLERFLSSYIARKKGYEEIIYDIPCMERCLKETYGIIIYQEQLMELSQILAGLTREESDTLRKAMAKKKQTILDEMKPKFIEGGKKNGYDPKTLLKIWTDWETEYGFRAYMKSHAVSSTWLAYQTAYLKAHYPDEYMSAYNEFYKNELHYGKKEKDI